MFAVLDQLYRVPASLEKQLSFFQYFFDKKWRAVSFFKENSAILKKEIEWPADNFLVAEQIRQEMNTRK